MAHDRLPGSMTAYAQVASVAWGSAMAVRLSCRMTSAGGRSRFASVKAAALSLVMTVAASGPWPITSPTISPALSPGTE